VDLNQVLDRVDMDQLMAKVDINEIADRIDIEALVKNTISARSWPAPQAQSSPRPSTWDEATLSAWTTPSHAG